MKHKQKRLAIAKEKRLEKIHYRILILLIVIWLVYNMFFEPTTIGHDSRYTIYVFFLPNIVGMLILAIYNKDYLFKVITISANLVEKTIIIFIVIFQGFLFSFLSIGLVSQITFNYYNNDIAKQNKTETITCEITKFSYGKRKKIDFIFNNQYNTFHVHYKNIREYHNKLPSDYKLEISAQKGLWNYYLVNYWTIKKITK